ncbi:DUF4179 domain-containing protein [Brevibacillus formosus]|uniref:DUF4179 domain-containing protein n=1 Tax=Brevibacillus formosus TaxID=54913 RepID=A0A837KKY5_9BACL|nr:DUF4179 domain-containing protein [Brevibacillus formosus]KLH98134.1 hypothetical protein AA984_14025 [Brevibacillus formosus]MED1956993.1 DUF4179 domain-containing protein [Brevibacillus formosus]PSJ96436.1 DUF4179 domain-containing protein [Brevibacillus formosus]GED59301.1 hypothetical protein BFO01nite_34330 [Brevibacillus formosus]
MNRNPDEIVSEQIESFAKWLEAPHSELRSGALAYEAPELIGIVKQLERENRIHTPDEETVARIRSHLFATMPHEQSSSPRLRMKRIFIASAGAASFLLFTLLALGFSSPAWAEKLKHVPLISSVFELFQEDTLQIANEKGLITAVNQSAVVNGITITVNEVFYDGIQLGIGYLIQMPETTEKAAAKEIAERIVLKDFTLAEPIDNTGAGWSSEVKQMEDYLFAGVSIITLNGTWPDQFTMQAQLYDYQNAQSTWNLQLPVVKPFTKIDSKTLTPHISQTLRSNFAFQVKEVTLTPVSTTVVLKETPPDDKLYEPSYTLLDPNGKEIRIEEESTNYDENGISRKLIVSFKEKPAYIQLIPHMSGKAEPDKAVKISLQ